MEVNQLEEFLVLALNAPETPLHTWVSHCVSADGNQDVVRIEQFNQDREDDNDVIILTRFDFERIAAKLKGH